MGSVKEQHGGCGGGGGGGGGGKGGGVSQWIQFVVANASAFASWLNAVDDCSA